MSYLHADARISTARISTKSRERAVRGTSVVQELKDFNSVWSGRIRAPGRPGRRSDGFTIGQVTFIRSLRPLLDMPLLAHANPVTLALILNAYWGGITKVLPEPFDPAADPKDYVIQKHQGATVLHSVLPQVIEVLPSWGRSLTDPIAYADVMHDLPTLTGEVVTDAGVKTVTDAEFWLADTAGAASQFRGDAGRKRLSAQVRALVPRPAAGLEI